jgi:SNF2 family DNA or RNA helicase
MNAQQTAPLAWPIRDGQHWRLTVPDLSIDDSLAERFAHIPGLAVIRKLNYVSGPIDAMVIACKRLGLDWTPAERIAWQPSMPRVPETFRPYQGTGVSWLCRKLRADAGALLADEMGLGKTAQAIVTAANLGMRKTLIICPGSVRPTWEAELKKWAPNCETEVILSGVGAKDMVIASEQRLFTVTSYELAAKLPDSYSPDMVVIDEAHLIKGRVTARSRQVEQLAAQATYRLAMTGTPIWSRPRDLFMIFKILFRSRFGTADEFDYAYCAAFENEFGGKKNGGVSRADELAARLKYVMLRRMKRDVATDLPPLTRTVEWLDAEPAATRAFQNAMMSQSKAATALKTTLRGKMRRAIELAAEAKRFLLVTWMKSHAAEMARRLNEDGTPCVLITGDLDVSLRTALIRQAAQANHGVVATTDSIGTGVDGLQHVASIGIVHALDYTPLKLLQLEARLDRIGQKEPVQWIYLAMKDSMDQQVVHVAVDKLDQTRAVMGELYGLRDSLGDSENGVGTEEAEKAALRAMYEEIK